MSQREQTYAVARKLADYCQTGQELKGLEELYASDALSVESMAMEGEESNVKQGVEAIRGKHDWWNSSFDVHEASVKGPYLHGDDQFSLIFSIDCTHKESGERSAMEEVAIYTVAGDKITKEAFFYNQPNEATV